MQKNKVLLTAALGLITSAFTVHTGYAQVVQTQAATSASIKISALPFTITAPGTYVLTGNLNFSSYTGAGVNISTVVAGPVVLDFKGFTITGDRTSYGVSINSGLLNTYSFTIRNGTIKNGITGIRVTGSFADVIVNHMVFINQSGVGAVGVEFDNLNSSTISNCTFNSTYYGIYDQNSTGGNSYNNNSFVNTLIFITVYGSGNGVLKLDRCQ
jgi:hypothetical protein